MAKELLLPLLQALVEFDMGLAQELRKIANDIKSKRVIVGKRLEGYDLVKRAASVKLAIYRRLLQTLVR